MTKEEIIYGNKIMANYLGYEYYSYNNPYISTEGRFVGYILSKAHLKNSNFKLCRSHRDLPFYNSWNSLMRVVDKIESEGYTVGIYKTHTYIADSKAMPVVYRVGIDKKESCWSACLFFIKECKNTLNDV